MNNLATFLRESRTARLFMSSGMILIAFSIIVFFINSRNSDYIEIESTVSNVQLAREAYTDSDGIKKNPYIIHRTSLGCYERTLALLLEKYAGALPLWLSPEQVRILPMNEHMVDFAHKMKDKFYECGIKRVSVDNSNEKIGYKIRVAQEEKIPYMVILGQKEVENNKISVRHRSKGDLGNMSFDEFTSMILDEISKKIWFYEIPNLF